MQSPNQDENMFLPVLSQISSHDFQITPLELYQKNTSWINLPHFHLTLITQLRAGHQTYCPFQEGFGTSTSGLINP